MTDVPTTAGRTVGSSDRSAAAQATARWLRDLSRALRTIRLSRPGNPLIDQLKDTLAHDLSELLSRHGALELRVTATEILLGDEPVVRLGRAASVEGLRAADGQQLFPFLRDGIHRVVIHPGLSREELDTLVEALRVTGIGPDTQDDLVTLLWAGDLTHLQIEAAPPDQVIEVSTGQSVGHGDRDPDRKAGARPATGAGTRGPVEPDARALGLSRDTFDDWELPDQCAEVPEAYERLRPAMEAARARLEARLQEEAARDWTAQAPDLMRLLLRLDGSHEMRLALVHAATTWIAGALQRAAWEEAQLALSLLRELDPERVHGEVELRTALAGLDTDDITNRLDQSGPDDQARFSALAVALGKSAVDMACTVMSKSNQMRMRAAACAALCSLCSDEPDLIAPYLKDSRWTVVRNVVFVLGQVGGPRVLHLLRMAADHPELRVRRELVMALGSVPPGERVPMLVSQLESRDPVLLAATLDMLARDQDPRATCAILERIEAPDFESRGQDTQRAFFDALVEVADDSSVGALQGLLHKGGWFARRTYARVAAARALRRIGSGRAMAVLEAGLRSTSEAVRAACLDALSLRDAA